MFVLFFAALWNGVVEEEVDWPSEKEFSGVAEAAVWKFPWVGWAFFFVIVVTAFGAVVGAEKSAKFVENWVLGSEIACFFGFTAHLFGFLKLLLTCCYC